MDANTRRSCGGGGAAAPWARPASAELCSCRDWREKPGAWRDVAQLGVKQVTQGVLGRSSPTSVLFVSQQNLPPDRFWYLRHISSASPVSVLSGYKN